MFIYLCVLHFHMLLVMLHYLMIKLNNMKPKMFDEMGMPAATSCVKWTLVNELWCLLSSVYFSGCIFDDACCVTKAKEYSI